mmetsp:Transcript_47362/g.133641  ORF Transcript_47362/g.133641 Transcript_47362/m.133641 type:complete len:223 (+) Transcript_47362:594-1262(+)
MGSSPCVSRRTRASQKRAGPRTAPSPTLRASVTASLASLTVSSEVFFIVFSSSAVIMIALLATMTWIIICTSIVLSPVVREKRSPSRDIRPASTTSSVWLSTKAHMCIARISFIRKPASRSSSRRCFACTRALLGFPRKRNRSVAYSWTPASARTSCISWHCWVAWSMIFWKSSFFRSVFMASSIPTRTVKARIWPCLLLSFSNRSSALCTAPLPWEYFPSM